MNKKLGLDLDGLLFDFHKAFFEWLDQPQVWYPIWEDPFITNNFHLIKDNLDFWRGIPPYTDTGIEKIDFDCYITARGIPSEVSHECLIRHGFPDKPVYTVGHLDSKVSICRKLGITHFVDDRPKNCQELEEAWITTYLWDSPCNRTVEHSRRIDYLPQVDPIFWKEPSLQSQEDT